MSSPRRSRARFRQDLLMALSRRSGRPLAPPDWLSVNLTLRCNLSCRMCTTCYDAGEEMDTGRILDIVDQAAAWGVEVFNPLGGEPLVRPDAAHILEHAARRGLYVTLTTNGTLLSRELARRLARIPPDRLHLNLSLDGPSEIHDDIRGPGTFEATLAGYRRLRRADADAGNPRRKILANVLLHDRVLEDLPRFLDDLADRGFEGAQILTLYRPGSGNQAGPAGDLWIPPHRQPLLKQRTRELIRRVEEPAHPRFRVLNAPRDLALLPAYYTGRVPPLEAPCWAGWKELYVNVDGEVILCDGALDFLAGGVGNVHRQTLREIWSGPPIRQRRKIVRRCRTPCIQTCYLRRESDSWVGLAREGARQLQAEARRRTAPAVRALSRRVPRLRSPHRVAPGLLTLELTDVCDCDWSGCPTPRARRAALLAGAPEPLDACRRDPERWGRWRDQHHVNFGRGFMGFDLLREVVEDLAAHRMGFSTVALRWRGEPLLHPEIEGIVAWLLEAVGPDRPFRRLRLHTSGLLLTPRLEALLRQPRPGAIDWWIDLDRMGAWQDTGCRRLAPILRDLPPGDRVVLRRVVLPGAPPPVRTDLERWGPAVPGLEAVAGDRFAQSPRHSGACRYGPRLYWLTRTEPRTFLGDREADEALRQAAASAGIVHRRAAPTGTRRCGLVHHTATVTWDGKLTPCPWDRDLALRTGEVTSEPLSRAWNGPALRQLRRTAALRGVPDAPPCRDCHLVHSPNDPLVGTDPDRNREDQEDPVQEGSSSPPARPSTSATP